MKKILTLIIGLIVGLPAFANAATFVVATSTDTHAVGDTITLNVSVDPEGATMYTAMLDAQFSASTLEVVSFTQSDKMLALKQQGYDTLDNGSGSLIKTAGYPGGINTVTPFGTIVFRAKNAGPATLAVTDKSLLLDSKNVDQQKGEKVMSFIIAKSKNNPILATVTPEVATTVTSQEAQALQMPTSASAPTSTSVHTSVPSSQQTINDNQVALVADAPAPTQVSGISSTTTKPIAQLAAVIVANAGENSLALGILALLLVLILSFYIAHTRNLFAGVVQKFKKEGNQS